MNQDSWEWKNESGLSGMDQDVQEWTRTFRNEPGILRKQVA